MPPKIGPKRLKRLLDAGVDLHQLPLDQRFEAFATMARVMTQPLTYTPKRDRPRCGARCRDGHRCQRRAAWDEDRDSARNDRCPNHGGNSTGPRTPEGRRHIGEAARQRAQVRRLAQVQAAARAEALAAYQAALAAYEAVRQHPMPGFAGLKAAMME